MRDGRSKTDVTSSRWAELCDQRLVHLLADLSLPPQSADPDCISRSLSWRCDLLMRKLIKEARLLHEALPLAGAATELALTARRFGAEEALALGLVSKVLPDDSALTQHVERVAAQIAAKSPLAITGTKRVLLHARCCHFSRLGSLRLQQAESSSLLWQNVLLQLLAVAA